MVQFPAKLLPLFEPADWKVLYGGRYSGKSWGVARALLLDGAQRQLRVLCVRQQQNSISESVHQVLSEQIAELGLQAEYEILKSNIRGRHNGTEFFFEGIHRNVDRIRSYEGVDRCWVEEAHLVTPDSWNVLIPTIRKPGAEIWVTFNPNLETDYTYQFLVKNPPKGAVVIRMNWRDLDAGWLSPRIIRAIDDLKRRDPDAYLNVYEGECKLLLEGAVYANELRDIRAQGRICNVPVDPHVGVDVFFDLGWSDSTALWLRQRVGFEYHYVGYYENRQRKLSHYLEWLQAQGLLYATFWLPHDARAKELGSGTSIEEQVRKSGKFGSVRIVKRLEIEDGINAGRELLPMCYFDETKCAQGLRALSAYRYEIVEKAGTLSKLPLHDWTSHGADAFRYSAVSLRQPKTDRAEAKALRRQLGPMAARAQAELLRKPIDLQPDAMTGLPGFWNNNEGYSEGGGWLR